MKKTKLVIVATIVAVLGLSACSKYSNKAVEVELKTEVDSLNYTFGLLNARMVKSILAKDTTDKAFNKFMAILDKSFKNSDKDETYLQAKQIGERLQENTKTGLFGDSALVFDKKVVVKTIIKVLNNKKVDMTMEEATTFIQTTMAKKDSEKTEELVDSLNYAFGVANANEFKMYIPALANDTTGKNTKMFIKGLKKGLSEKTKTEIEKSAEQFGFWLGMQKEKGLMADSALTLHYPLIRQGVVNGVKNDKLGFSMQQANEYLSTTMQKRQEKVLEVKFAKEKAENLKFLEENKSKKGIVTTKSGLQYKVLRKSRRGKYPKLTDKIKVHYVGKLIDGTEFDSSIARKKPAEFYLNGVIKGWQEGLQLMRVGSKYRFYIPYYLGYGAKGTPTIPPFSTLIFEVRLLKIEK